MQTQIDCIPCFVRQALEAAKQVCDNEETINKSMRRVLKAASEFDFALSPPEMGQIIHKIIREETGNPDPYLSIKKKSTQCALDLLDNAREAVKHADNPFNAAVKFSIAGNILDFALLSTWDTGRIDASFEKAAHNSIDDTMALELEEKLKCAKTILILGDNAGEAVFDKLLIENIKSDGKIYYAVKDKPIINDSIIDDAIDAGLDEVSTIITNGTDGPGTILDQCSPEFLEIYNSADVVIAKGQANFETLNKEERKVYLVLQIKCSVIAEKYGFKVGNWVVTSTHALNEVK